MHYLCSLCNGKQQIEYAYGAGFSVCQQCKLAVRVQIFNNFQDTHQYSTGQRERFIYEFIGGLLDDPKTLIFGSGETRDQHLLMSRSTNIYLSDINHRVVKSGKHKYGNDRVKTNCELNRGLDFYDLIISSEVIEHFSMPHKQLMNLLSLLAPEGVFVCTTDLYDGNNLEEPAKFMSKPGHNTYWTESAIKIVASYLNMQVYVFQMLRPGQILESKRSNIFRPRKRVIFVTNGFERFFSSWKKKTEYFSYCGE